MQYEAGDHAVSHNHFPADFSVVIYLDVSDDSSPITFENDLTITPKSGMMIIFPGMINHEVPQTNAKRIVLAMNLHKK